MAGVVLQVTPPGVMGGVHTQTRVPVSLMHNTDEPIE